MKMLKRTTLEASKLEDGTVQITVNGKPHHFSPEFGKQVALTIYQEWFRPTKPPEPPKAG